MDGTRLDLRRFDAGSSSGALPLPFLSLDCLDGDDWLNGLGRAGLYLAARASMRFATGEVDGPETDDAGAGDCCAVLAAGESIDCRFFCFLRLELDESGAGDGVEGGVSEGRASTTRF